jgi:cellulose synthase (UDP-forming)
MLFPSSTPTRLGRADREDRREAMLTRMAITWTVLAATLMSASFGADLLRGLRAGQLRRSAELAVFLLIVLFLIFGGLVYQVARYGHFRRKMAHRHEDLDDLDDLAGLTAPLAILVPSYKEDLALVRQTLLSAALQDHAGRHVVLLIDDPPTPGSDTDREALGAARRLPGELQRLLEAPRRSFELAQQDFEDRARSGVLDHLAETRLVADLYERAARWLEDLADGEDVHDHTGRFFVAEILRAPAADHRRRAARLRALGTRQALTTPLLRREHRRLASLFTAELSAFERKRFANLSHEPNKAMNLNSYMSLLGGSYRFVLGADGLCLQPDPDGGLRIPAADYLITLDADSLLLPGYARRLVRLMQEPGNERLAVAQTPYSAVAGAPGPVEHLAGATTHIMHVLHQGTSHFDATFWVGANALLRMSAMRDIAQTTLERGHPVTRFIQDRTVIEDTESSVDLIARGWRLENYPARLAYSATPPDYGSLLIQRRRWANGGLLILPKLLRYALDGPGRLRRLPEVAMRLHYLTSIAGVNVGLLIVLAYPFKTIRVPLALPLSALPYFALYARDLARAGYRPLDVVRVYALNLLLLPVNLGGALKSLHQACTGRQIPFGRTPKTSTRTPAPPLYLLATFALLAQWTIGTGFDLAGGRLMNGTFGALNVALLGYAATRFVGWRAGLEDVRESLAERHAARRVRWDHAPGRFRRLAAPRTSPIRTHRPGCPREQLLSAVVPLEAGAHR